MSAVHRRHLMLLLLLLTQLPQHMHPGVLLGASVLSYVCEVALPFSCQTCTQKGCDIHTVLHCRHT